MNAPGLGSPVTARVIFTALADAGEVSLSASAPEIWGLSHREPNRSFVQRGEVIPAMASRTVTMREGDEQVLIVVTPPVHEAGNYSIIASATAPVPPRYAGVTQGRVEDILWVHIDDGGAVADRNIYNLPSDSFGAHPVGPTRSSPEELSQDAASDPAGSDYVMSSAFPNANLWIAYYGEDSTYTSVAGIRVRVQIWGRDQYGSPILLSDTQQVTDENGEYIVDCSDVGQSGPPVVW